MTNRPVATLAALRMSTSNELSMIGDVVGSMLYWLQGPLTLRRCHLLFIRSDIALGRSVGRTPKSSPRGHQDQRELRERGNGRCYEALTLLCPG